MAAETDDAFDLGEDRLRGVRKIAAYLKENERRTRYLIALGAIPTAKEGHFRIASKRALRKAWNKKTGGDAE